MRRKGGGRETFTASLTRQVIAGHCRNIVSWTWPVAPPNSSSVFLFESCTSLELISNVSWKTLPMLSRGMLLHTLSLWSFSLNFFSRLFLPLIHTFISPTLINYETVGEGASAYTYRGRGRGQCPCHFSATPHHIFLR